MQDNNLNVLLQAAQEAARVNTHTHTHTHTHVKGVSVINCVCVCRYQTCILWFFRQCRCRYWRTTFPSPGSLWFRSKHIISEHWLITTPLRRCVTAQVNYWTSLCVYWLMTSCVHHQFRKSRIFNVFDRRLLCSPNLHLFDKYSKINQCYQCWKLDYSSIQKSGVGK